MDKHAPVCINRDQEDLGPTWIPDDEFVPPDSASREEQLAAYRKAVAEQYIRRQALAVKQSKQTCLPQIL